MRYFQMSTISTISGAFNGQSVNTRLFWEHLGVGQQKPMCDHVNYESGAV